jgi:hypothetical protein
VICSPSTRFRLLSNYEGLRYTSKVRVFVDTNIILEAFRTGCWTAICQHYAIETVEKCIEEARTGDPTDPRRIPVDRDVLVAGLAGRHSVSNRERVDLVLAYPIVKPSTMSSFIYWLGSMPRPIDGIEPGLFCVFNPGNPRANSASAGEHRCAPQYPRARRAQRAPQRGANRSTGPQVHGQVGAR